MLLVFYLCRWVYVTQLEQLLTNNRDLQGVYRQQVVVVTQHLSNPVLIRFEQVNQKPSIILKNSQPKFPQNIMQLKRSINNFILPLNMMIKFLRIKRQVNRIPHEFQQSHLVYPIVLLVVHLTLVCVQLQLTTLEIAFQVVV